MNDREDSSINYGKLCHFERYKNVFILSFSDMGGESYYEENSTLLANKA